ncbi:MAG: LysR substrate-binding domain-containing protein [Polaromonas sp.]
MKFSYVRAFKAVYELGTVTSAANHLYVTQPAVSRLISQLEDELGFVLFERIKGRLLPTDQGRAFYQEVERFFIGLDRLEKSGKAIRHRQSGGLVIASMPLLSNLFIPEVMCRFLAAHPDSPVKLQTFRSEEVIERTAIQSCDLGFSLIPGTGSAIDCFRLRCFNVCIFPDDSHALGHKKVSPGAMAALRLLRNENDPSQKLLDAVFSQQGLVTPQQVEVSFASSLGALVAKGLGSAVTDPFTAHIARSQSRKVAVRRFALDLAFDFYLLLPRLRPVSTSTRVFISQFMALAAEEGIELAVCQIDSNGDAREVGADWYQGRPG